MIETALEAPSRVTDRFRARWLAKEMPGVVVVLAALALYFTLYELVDGEAGNSDGFYAWLYARSLAFDHDIEFKNDYALCGDPAGIAVDRGTGHLDNPYYPGPGMLWAPILAVLRWLKPLAATAPEAISAACKGPLVHATLHLAPVAGGLTIGLSYLICRRFVGPMSAAAAAALFAFSSSLLMYATLLPGYSHVYEAVSLALLAWCSMRASEKPTSTLRWVLCGLMGALCSLQRMTNAVFVLVPCVLALITKGERLTTRLSRVAIVLPLGAIGPCLSFAIYRYLYGSFTKLPQGQHYLHLSHAHPWLVLFAPAGGLFYTTPAAWLSVAGLAILLVSKKTRPFAAAVAVCSAIIVFLAGSVLDWHGSATYGARRLVVLTPYMILCAAVACNHIGSWLREKRHRVEAALVAAVVLPLGATSIGEIWGIGNTTMPLTGSTQAGQYGGGRTVFWRWLDDKVGPVFVLPAAVVLHLRFGVPMARLFEVTEDRWYTRNPRTLAWGPRDLKGTDPAVEKLQVGFWPGPEGLGFHEGRGSLTFATEWPFADQLELELSSQGQAEIDVWFATFFKRRKLGSLAVAPSPTTKQSLTIPAGVFDSGIAQIAFRCKGDCDHVVLRNLHLDDTREIPPAF